MLLAAILAATLLDPLASSQRASRALEKSLDAHCSPDPKVTLTIRSDFTNEGHRDSFSDRGGSSASQRGSCARAATAAQSLLSAHDLAPNVWLLENVSHTTAQWSYNVLVVALDDGVLIAEAPVDSATTERVLEKVRELVPGKPVQYVVQRHHHSDHLGGIRPYVADGVTILTGATASRSSKRSRNQRRSGP